MIRQPATHRLAQDRQRIDAMATVIASLPRPLADRRGIVADLGERFDQEQIAAHVAAATKAARGLRAERGVLVTRIKR